MSTQLCPSPLRNRRQRPSHKQEGQVLVIFAVALLALIFFIGLAVDAGSLYVTYGQLKRAVDSAAVAAANEFKKGQNLAPTTAQIVDRITKAATEVLRLQNVDMSSVDLKLFVCDSDPKPADFASYCPSATQSPRKLVWVEAKQAAPLYFLGLLGFKAVDLHTNAIAEAAPLDVVIVIDTSESMASECKTWVPTLGGGQTCTEFKSPNYNPTNYNPDDDGNCNTTNTCYPLQDAKDAAKGLVNTFYEGYDQVGVVSFDSKATIMTNLSTDLSTTVMTKLDQIRLHDDAPSALLWPNWRGSNKVNPVNPEDRDGDGRDADPALPCTLDADRWDEARNIPCDDDTKFDAFHWSYPGDAACVANPSNPLCQWTYVDQDDTIGRSKSALSILSTCTGCGIRTASNILREYGRPGAVWAIVFLSDGSANLSDTPATAGSPPNGPIPAGFPNGFCTQRYWPYCYISNFASIPRYNRDADSAGHATADTRPPGSVSDYATGPSTSYYNVLNYAMDMIDEAALTRSTNLKEPSGNDIAIYSIGLDVDNYGEYLLRYMAAVGDDGDRTTDPCSASSPRTKCGQYYFAPNGPALQQVFDDIATRIYTRITQ